MNVHSLQEEEARYLLFSIKKTLREKDILPTTQVQFYEALFQSLQNKILRIDRAGEGHPDPPARDKFAKVRPSWHDISLGNFQDHPPTDT